ncbi:malonate decarboxylase holo-[acyl-carrier-protein] synthase [Martelella sp. FOR1707]
MIRRHDMVFIHRTCWPAVLASEPDLRVTRLVALWAERGWPLVARRADPWTRGGLALGLPLPPSQGKRRHAFVVAPGSTSGSMPPPSLDNVRRVAPASWSATLLRLEALRQRRALDIRVFGSLAWSAITGLDYLTAVSDIDILIRIRPTTALDRLADEIAEIEAAAPMRIDGELVRHDGLAVNWREFHSGVPNLLAKSMTDLCLVPRDLFASTKVAT